MKLKKGDIALARAVKVEQWIREKNGRIPIKEHGKREISIFKKGSDWLQEAFLNHNFRVINKALRALSCT